MAILQRYTTLDGMRGVAAITVTLHHFSQHTATPIFGYADLAVDLFFCLSGFVLASSYWHRLGDDLSLRQFVVRRLVRLYPMYLLGLLCGAVALAGKMAAGQSDATAPDLIVAFLLNVLYLPGFVRFHVDYGNASISGMLFPFDHPAWSLSLELLVNFLFAGWVLRRADCNPLLPALLGVLLLAVYEALMHFPAPGWGQDSLVGGLPRTLAGFFLGVSLFAALASLRRHLPRVRPLWLMLVLLAAFHADPQLARGGALVWMCGALLLMPLVVALGAVAQPGSAALRQGFAYLGWLSYPLYCLHFPILGFYTLLTHNQDLGWPGMLACVFWSLIAAHLAARYVDAPVRTWLLRRRPGAQSMAG